jgi:DNA-directed RNA polymerase specialized sigma24 family protein
MNIRKLIERFNPIHREPKRPGADIDAIAGCLFRELTEQPEPFDPTELIGDITELGSRDCGKISSEAGTRALVDVLLHLPVRQRLVMEMSLQDYTPQEIAKALGITLSVAISEHAKVMNMLREQDIV